MQSSDTKAVRAVRREVLHLVAAGKSDRQIASILGASHWTVQEHLERICVRLGFEIRTATAMRAMRGREFVPL
jgi:DNA-binding CsgD family transcriptional regulator